MSTRATYQFKPEDKWSPTITLYIHHDGYQEGAAAYAHEVAKYAGPTKGGIVERWIRALPGDAEITRDHNAHGDTEYRYTFTNRGTQVKVQGCIYRKDEKSWTTLYEGPTAEWINDQLKLEGADRCVILHGEVETVQKVLEKMQEEIKLAKHYEGGNRSWAISQLHQHAKGIPEAEALVKESLLT